MDRALLWERIWRKQISMGVQQIPALQEQKCVLPCCQWGDIRWNWPLYTARLCQRSQTKAIWSTAACPSTNNTARGDGYSVTTVQFTQSKTNTSLQLLIRKGFRFTNPHTQGYGRDLRPFEWQQHTRHHQFSHNFLHERMFSCLNWPE